MAGQIVLSPKDGPLKGAIDLPISKSIANRLLILQALSGSTLELNQENLPDDVRLMVNALTSYESHINLENAGTAMRFLTAYFAVQEGRTVVLDGNEAMRKRPIWPLVDALNSLGANIIYEGENGFPPIRVNGKSGIGKYVEIDGDTSSQFVSALMLIGSFLDDGLEIEIQGEPVSSSYLKLTADLINQADGKVEYDESTIRIHHSSIDIHQSTIETDWSAASYFYAMAALKPGSELLLRGLDLESSQGDRRISSIMTEFGVSSTQVEEGVLIRSSRPAPSGRFNYDLSSQPDLVQTLACFHATRGDEVTYSGIDHLKFKETDRLTALHNELKKFGVEFISSENGWQQRGKAVWNGEPIKTYGDHRMAMAFSILSFEIDRPVIEDPEVVNKSFPDYWNQLKVLI